MACPSYRAQDRSDPAIWPHWPHAVCSYPTAFDRCLDRFARSVYTAHEGPLCNPSNIPWCAHRRYHRNCSHQGNLISYPISVGVFFRLQGIILHIMEGNTSKIKNMIAALNIEKNGLGGSESASNTVLDINGARLAQVCTGGHYARFLPRRSSGAGLSCRAGSGPNSIYANVSSSIEIEAPSEIQWNDLCLVQRISPQRIRVRSNKPLPSR